MNESTETEAEWMIVFCKAKGTNIVTPFLQEGFTHCYAMKKSEGGLMWHIVDSMMSHLTIEMQTVDNYPHARAYAGRDAVILPVTAKIDINKMRGTLGIFNCVEVVKALLGIKETWVWTPYQLFKYLKGCENG